LQQHWALLQVVLARLAPGSSSDKQQHSIQKAQTPQMALTLLLQTSTQVP
jgi:hypothetical protein